MHKGIGLMAYFKPPNDHVSMVIYDCGPVVKDYGAIVKFCEFHLTKVLHASVFFLYGTLHQVPVLWMRKGLNYPEVSKY